MTERKLNYPFTIKYPCSRPWERGMEVLQGTNGYVSLYDLDDHIPYPNHCTEADARGFIETGTWIVKDVEQSPQEAPIGSTELSVKFTLADYTYQLKRLAEASKAAYEAVEILNDVLKETENVNE